MHFHAAGQAAAGKGELDYANYWPRPDADGGEVPDRAVGSHIGSFSSQFFYDVTASILA